MPLIIEDMSEDDMTEPIIRWWRAPAKPPTGRTTRCNGDPNDLDGGAHPWETVGEDDEGIHYRCPVCGATDTD